MYQKERKLNPVLLIVLAAALLAVGIAVWFLLSHVWVAGSFYSRNADVLDLRFADVTTADYDKLRKKAPNSEKCGVQIWAGMNIARGQTSRVISSRSRASSPRMGRPSE